MAIRPCRRQPEVFVGIWGGDAALGGAFDEAELNEEGLVDFFEGLFFFSDGYGERGEADGASSEFMDDGIEDGFVHVVEAEFVDS